MTAGRVEDTTTEVGEPCPFSDEHLALVNKFLQVPAPDPMAAYRLGIRSWTPPAHLFSGQDRLRRLRALSISVRVLGFIFPCCLQRLHLKSARPQSYLL